MSLHKFAEQVASQGRGDDSLLVHMTPDEVQRLQAFAEANGRSLTINPTTGLPEAGFLSDLFKAVAPIALGAFLGPAGLGMSSMMAGVATGGITTLATGSLSRGLMAGLGAYGGAGLGASLAGASGMTGGAALGAGIPGDMAFNLADAGVAEAGIQSNVGAASKAIADAQPSLFDKLGAGAKNVASSSESLGSFAKQNLGNLGYAAAPILAGAMVPTTTKLGEPKDTGLIRQFDYNINPDTGRPDPLYGMRAMTPVKASEFGNKTFQGQRDLFRQQNPNPYELGVGSLNQPPQQQTTPMAGGGIVALADGGVPGYAGNAGSVVSAPLDTKNEIYQYFAKPETQALLASGNDAAVAQFLQDKDWKLADVAKATGTQNQLADFERRFTQAVATPTTDASEFLAATKDVGLTGQNLNTALQNSGLSASAQYALTHNLNDAAGTYDASGKPIDFYNKIGYTAGAAPGDQGGLEGLYANINYSAKALQDQINSGALTVYEAQALARGEMGRVGVNDKDIKNATGKDFASLFTPKTVTPITPLPQPFTSVVPGGTQLPGATTYANGAYGNYGSGPATGVDYRGNTVSIATPGDIITNPDGTRTVVPNVPGRPYGGFTGMEGVKSAYTAGGGSLGYTSPVRKDPEAYYNKMTNDSLDAYNFLMGKGKNLTQRKAETTNRPVMQRYDEAVLGRKIAKPTKTTTTDKVTTVVGTPGNPQSYFDEAAYLAANPSVAEELRTGKSVSGQPTRFTSGYQHYLMYGKAENRPFTGDYQGYLTALALASAAGAGGGGGGNTTSATTGNTASTVSDSNTANSISGLAAPANDSISVSDAVSSPASSATPSGGSTSVGDAAATSGDGDGDGDGGDGVGDARGGYYSRGKLNYRSKNMAMGGYAIGGGLGSLGSYSDGGRLLKGPGDGVSDSIPATIGRNRQPARLADGEFVIPARIVSELGNGSTDAGAKKLYAMMDRVQRARGKTTGKNKVAANSRSDKYLPA